MKDWADKYAGKFDDGWDAYRQRVFARAKDKGWIPPEAELTERHPDMAAWDDIPDDEKPFQRRLMEVAAGFAEHCDAQVGRLVDEVDRLGYGENTLILYIWGDNGSSGEGQNGTICELYRPERHPHHRGATHRRPRPARRTRRARVPKTENQYHAGWAWAGSTPFKGVKLLARTSAAPATRWRSAGRPPSPPTRCPASTSCTATTSSPPSTTSSGSPRPGWWRVPPGRARRCGVRRDPPRPGRTRRQTTPVLEVMGSRAIYHDGWMASAFGPRVPWLPGLPPGITDWTPDDTCGSCTTSTRTTPRTTTSPPSTPASSPNSRRSSRSKRRRTTSCRSAAACGCRSCTPNNASPRPTPGGSSPAPSPRMPEFCAPALGNKKTTGSPSTSPSPTRRTVSCTRSAAPAAD
ncbi:sulfatase-like hydrolase/transferase [Rhodococcus opacus]|nr:sulfatase-like hydrolase/transferase [Rhodococcus opacus]